jgi:hypothetical protein
MSVQLHIIGRVSAIAWFFVVHRDLLVHEDMPTARLAREFGREVAKDDFPYSGYLMMDMLFYLDGRGIPITDSVLDVKYDGSDGPLVEILTTEHRSLLPDLDPARFSLADVREALEDYDDLDDDEIAESFTDTLNFLRARITDLAPDEALVILIG